MKETERDIIASRLALLNKKMTIMTRALDEHAKALGELRKDVEGLKSPSRLPFASVLSGELSEWTKRSIQALSGADTLTLSQTFETYRPTISALRSSPKGLTADQVSQRTERTRQTEAAYLKRLHLAGVLSRKRAKKRVVYKIKDMGKILSLQSK